MLDPELTLIVSPARSGSTLLRLIVDAHPEIGCPAEAGIPSLIGALGRVWWTVDSGSAGDPGPNTPNRTDIDRPSEDEENSAESTPPRELPPVARAEIRQAALAVMRHYCSREGKSVYCDKSLDSVHHLEQVRQLFPAARYVLLFRHVMDTVASGIEASPWGFSGYGYGPFIQRSPENSVAALVSYWLSHVDAALGWQEAHPELCHRLRYEELVTNPQAVIDEVFAFLGVEPDPGVLERAFLRTRRAGGPGDYKVTFSSEVHSASIGHGKRVPVAMVPPPLLEAVNKKLKLLGYPPLDQRWNAEPAASNGRARELAGWEVRLVGLLGDARPLALAGPPPIDSFAVVAQDHAHLRWVVDLASGTIRQGDGEVDFVLTGTAEDLALLLSGEVNAGVLLRSGRIRHLSPHQKADPIHAIEAVGIVLDTLGGQGARPDHATAARR
jgi:protein-tyrosine sulfotransferase